MATSKDFNLVWFDQAGHEGANKAVADSFDEANYNLYTFVDKPSFKEWMSEQLKKGLDSKEMTRCFIFISSGAYAHELIDSSGVGGDSSSVEKMIVHDETGRYKDLYSKNYLVYGVVSGAELKSKVDELI